MRSTRHITAVLLLAAIAAVGCSKREESSAASASPEGGAVKPVATAGESPAPKPPDDAVLPAAMTVETAVPATFADGKAAYGEKKYGDAAAIFEGYVARKPENAWGHYMLALSAWKSGDPAKAEGAFETALSIDPRHVKSYVNLGRVLLEQKRNDEALAKLTRAADIDPESIEVQRLLGRTYLALGRIDEAEDAYRRAIELNELDAWSMNNLGLLLLDSGRADEAVPLLEKAVELRKEVPAFHNNLGMALEHAGRFGDAAAAYGAALALDPGYEKAQKNLSRIEGVK
jgi:tetratricopeptide (TPR) repeat protein